MMRREHVDSLTRNRVLLVRQLKVTEILLSCLRENYTLTDEMQQEIEAERTDMKKTSALLDLLVRRGSKAFDTFLRALVETRQDEIALALDQVGAERYIDQRDALERGRTSKPPSSSKRPSSQPPPSYAALTSTGALVTQAVDFGDGTGVSHPISESDMKDILAEINGNKHYQAKPLMNIQVKAATNSHLRNNEMVYPVRNKIRGRAVIVNNYYFVGKLSNRDGTNYDAENLKNLFEKLSFTVVIVSDKTAKELITVLEEESKLEDHQKADMFVLFLLSHGNQGNIFGLDCQPLSIENDITSLFSPENCPGLAGKPKLFFIQACQGKLKFCPKKYGHDSDVPDPLEDEMSEELNKVSEKLKDMQLEDQPGFVPGYHQKSDVLMAYATVKGYLAWRRSDLGSWFVRCLVSVFSRKAHCDHLQDMLTEVNYLLHKLETNEKEGHNRQLAEKSDSLIKKVYFFPDSSVNLS